MTEKEQKRKAWNFGIGMAKIDGGEPSSEFLELVEKEINGEITDEQLLGALIKKHTVKTKKITAPSAKVCGYLN